MFEHKRVIIIGGTSGVGYAVAERLRDQCQLLVLGRNEVRLSEMRACGYHVAAFDGLKDAWRDEWQADIVIFSAGCGFFEAAVDVTDAQIEQMCRTNIEMPMKLTSRIARHMIAQGGGQLLYIGSQAGKVATPKASVYAATKHALIGYTNALRMELAPHNVKVSVVHPGPIDTPFIDLADESGSYKQSLGRWLLSPEQVADAVIQIMRTRKRETNVPKAMFWSSKLYNLMPSLVETLGRSFFNKK
ncbi:SDR family NAD(P)-dependent oxidoreductase [Savagea sp. SN6]|uniref:SDR family NAD(P)-dependent oxidoreductase n=1 Tax=Savagea serpentis TaxID=2785297 RepID=A0A8J7G6X8_9BACL|nr:SDR family NAD(P)-dependent oxidoreductase [Savagea serpentis]MBF4500283.1 SDR family NAD(P)-dependent oxidoreductase [Savagea serpentis]